MPDTLEEEGLELDGTDIFDKAVLLVLSLPYGFGLKKKAPKDVIQSDAEDDWVEGYKKTLQSPEFEEIKSADAQLRAYISGRCLPSMNKLFRSGVYPLPIELVAEVDDRLEQHRELRQRLIEAFLNSYDARVDEARSALGDLFNTADYPSKDELRLNLAMRTQYITIDTPESLKGISDSIFKREAGKAEAMWLEAREEMKQALRLQLKELLDHLVDRLQPKADGKAKIFRNSMVANFEDFLGVFEAKNISNDEDLSKLVSKLRDITQGVTAENLRSDVDFKTDITRKFEEVKLELDTMLIDAPSRRFTLEEE